MIQVTMNNKMPVEKNEKQLIIMKKKRNVIVEKDVQNVPVLALNPIVDVIHHVNANHRVKIYSIILIISSVKIVNVLPVLAFLIGL
jgi:hypothetical protein